MKKCLSLILSVLMVMHVFSYAAFALETPRDKVKKAMLASEVKSALAHLGTGKSSVVRVLLTDDTKYHGYITEIADDHFVITDAKTGATAPIAYPEVKGIKGNNLSTGAKIGIGVAVAAAVVIIASLIANGDDDEIPNGQIICVTSPCP